MHRAKCKAEKGRTGSADFDRPSSPFTMTEKDSYQAQIHLRNGPAPRATRLAFRV